MTPLRQFKGVPADIIRKAEGKQFLWFRYFDLTPPEIGELSSIPNAGKLVHRLVHSFPKLHPQAQVQPITRSLLRIDLFITPDFRWDKKNYGVSEMISVMVEDVDGEIILFQDKFVLRAMDLSQMCVQAMWETDSPLKQIPHFDADVSVYLL